MYAANILLVGALAASQASLTFLVIAINPTRRLLISCYSILGFLAAWTLSSMFALAFQCHLPRSWDYGNNTCVDRFALNVGIYSFNILGDVLIVIVPFAMMQKVQVSSSRRFVVNALFSSRLRYANYPSSTSFELTPYAVSQPSPSLTWSSRGASSHPAVTTRPGAPL
jgi:hypothetical protein